MKYIFNIAIVCWLTVLTIMQFKEEPPPDLIIEWDSSDDFIKEWKASPENMLRACEYYGVKYPRIVTAQAILESGYFKSDVFKKHNNPFGMYNPSKNMYYKFDHWSDAILGYINMVEHKYRGGDYYKFLEDLPYATDKEYINKIKRIESNLPP